MAVKGWVPIAIRRASLKNSCEQCGATARLSLHHKDGDRTNNSPANLLTICPACHTRLHWQSGKKPWRRHSPSCEVCGKPAKRLGLCETHRTRWLRYGSPYLRRIRTGAGWLLVEDRGPQNGPLFRESYRGFPLGWT